MFLLAGLNFRHFLTFDLLFLGASACLKQKFPG